MSLICQIFHTRHDRIVSQWLRFGVFIVNFEHISDFFLVFLFLTLSMYLFGGELLNFKTDKKGFLSSNKITMIRPKTTIYGPEAILFFINMHWDEVFLRKKNHLIFLLHQVPFPFLVEVPFNILSHRATA